MRHRHSVPAAANDSQSACAAPGTQAGRQPERTSHRSQQDCRQCSSAHRAAGVEQADNGPANADEAGRHSEDGAAELSLADRWLLRLPARIPFIVHSQHSGKGSKLTEEVPRMTKTPHRNRHGAPTMHRSSLRNARRRESPRSMLLKPLQPRLDSRYITEGLQQHQIEDQPRSCCEDGCREVARAPGMERWGEGK